MEGEQVVESYLEGGPACAKSLWWDRTRTSCPTGQHGRIRNMAGGAREPGRGWDPMSLVVRAGDFKSDKKPCKEVVQGKAERTLIIPHSGAITPAADGEQWIKKEPHGQLGG